MTANFNDPNLKGMTMANLSEQLSDLSARVAKIEARAAEFKHASQDQRDAKVRELKAGVEAARAQFTSNVQSVNEDISSSWSALNQNLKSGVEKIRSDITAKKDAMDASRAKARADRLEDNAVASLGFAILAMEEAELAAVEAVDARLHAESLE